MATQVKHSCMPGTSKGDHAHVSPTCPFEVKMTLAVAKYLGNLIFNSIILWNQNQNTKFFNVTCKSNF